MERSGYEIEAEVQRRHWWFRGRRRILAGLLAGLDPPLPRGARVLDVGCGTGANTPVLAAEGRSVVGLDPSPLALGLHQRRVPEAAGRGATRRVRGHAGQLPFADASFDLVVALDVLEHLDDDRAAAAELRRVVRTGGAVVVFVPALRLLWGLQDEVSHHRRRYRRATLRAVVAAGGLKLERITYFNTLLFPPILAARLAMRLWRPAAVQSENQLGGPVANALLERLFSAEAPLLARTDLPVGVSLACVARR